MKKMKVRSEEEEEDLLATQWLLVQENIRIEVRILEKSISEIIADFMSHTGLFVDSISIGWDEDEDEDYKIRVGNKVDPNDVNIEIKIGSLEPYKPSRHEPKEGKKEKYRDELGR